MRRSRRYAVTVLAGFALLSTGLVPAAIAQAQSVNRDFEDPDVERDVSRFERDGRAGVRHALRDHGPARPEAGHGCG